LIYICKKIKIKFYIFYKFGLFGYYSWKSGYFKKQRIKYMDIKIRR